MADPRYAQFASSDPNGPDAAFWEQKVYFDGVPRRREIVATLAATPGLSERAARLLLVTAPVADGQPAARPPAAWFATGVIPTPGGAHLEEDDEDEDDLDDDDEGPQHNHLPLIG